MFNQQQSSQGIPSLDQVMAGGTPSAFDKDDPINTSVNGSITSIEARQQTDFDSGQPKFFDDGRPMMQVVIHLQTTMNDPSNLADDGQRAIYVKGKNIGNLRAAAQKAVGANFPAVGDGLTVTYVGDDEPKRRGYRGAKLYSFQITKGAGALDQAMQQAPAQAQAPSNPAASYMQPQQQMPAQQPAAPQQQPSVNVNQIRQLATLGKSPEEINRLTNAGIDVIRNILGTTTTAPAQGEPAF